MENARGFVDYYNLLQVNPNCDERILEVAYRYFAKLYHPDHAETADVDKFNEVTDAYRMLRDPERRAEYDRAYASYSKETNNRFVSNDALDIDENTAVKDAELHEKILLCLYKRRRENSQDAGVAGWLLQELLEFSDDDFEFHVWYLKSKGFIELTEQGTLAVTIQGVDHVISMSRTTLTAKLLTDQKDDAGD